MLLRRTSCSNSPTAAWWPPSRTKRRRLSASSHTDKVWNSSLKRSEPSDQPTMPGAAFACFMMLIERVRNAGTRCMDFRKKREVKATYSRSGSTTARCFQGIGGGNIVVLYLLLSDCCRPLQQWVRRQVFSSQRLRLIGFAREFCCPSC